MNIGPQSESAQLCCCVHIVHNERYNQFVEPVQNTRRYHENGSVQRHGLRCIPLDRLLSIVGKAEDRDRLSIGR